MSVRLKVALVVACLWSTFSCAADNYSTNPAALAIVDELVAEQDFDREELLLVFASAQRQESILTAISRPAEKSKPWYEYREIFLNEKRLEQGLEFYAEHRDTLERAEQETGVPAEIIVAIIGVETYYGRVAGSYRVIDALSTLAFDYPRRSEFFTSELKSYLILTASRALIRSLLRAPMPAPWDTVSSCRAASSPMPWTLTAMKWQISGTIRWMQ